jgi:hypothetical protein
MTIKAILHNGSIPPLEPLPSQWSDGQELVVEDPSPPSPATGPSALDWIADNAVNDPAIPLDLAHQHDHYLYNIPKKP